MSNSSFQCGYPKCRHFVRGKAFDGARVPGERETPSFSVGILGDLHLEPAQMHLFEEARAQLAEHLAKPDVPGARVVQLGDLGGYSNRPGGSLWIVSSGQTLAGVHQAAC